MRSLDEIMNDYGSGKGTCDKGYTLIYEEIFEPIRDNRLKILEIGYGEGASLKGWVEYFPRAFITVVDIACNYENKVRVKVPGINQGKLSDLDSIVVHSDDYDIVVDDGSHKSLHILQTMGMYYHILKKGGYYIIEDLDCRRAKQARKLIKKDWNTFKQGWAEAHLYNDNLFIGKK